MKSLTKFLLLAGLILANIVNAQPVSGWKHYFANGGGGFMDLYACSGGDLLMCGYNNGPCLARISAAGAEVWANNVENGVGGIAVTIIEADNGDVLMGGEFNRSFTVFRYRANGELIWRRNYGTGMCNAIIELKSGNFAVAGFSPELARSRARLIIIDGDGGEVMNRDYEHGQMPQFWCMREVEDGLVLMGNTYSGGLYRAWLTKVDFDGNPDWTVDYNQDFLHASSYNGLVTAGDGGYVLQMFTYQNGPWLIGFIKVDREGNVVWTSPFHDMIVYGMPGIVHLPNVGFLSVMSLQNGLPAALCVDDEGHEQWRSTYRADRNDDFDPSAFRSVVLGADGRAYAAGDAMIRDGGLRGFVMCLGNVDYNPEIMHWSPLDTMQTVLLGDKITFSAVASDPFGGQVGYNWFVADTVYHCSDTTITVTFDSLGVINVGCVISTAHASTRIIWHVTVTDLLLLSYTPDSLNLTEHRGNTIDFSIDSVRVAEGEQENYVWSLADLNNPDHTDVGMEKSVSIPFPRAGNYAVEGLVSRGETLRHVVWTVEVRSCIADYWPLEMELTVPQDTLISFDIVPYNPEPGMTHYRWLFDEQEMEVDTARIDFQFSDPGAHEVWVMVSDSLYTDTLHWQIMTLPANGIGETANRYAPANLTVTSSPNPFNATTLIEIAMPRAGDIGVRLYDLSGRLIAGKNQRSVRAGYYRSELGELLNSDIGKLNSGIYFLKVEAGGASVTQKLVLSR